jgi:hypothetical protein
MSSEGRRSPRFAFYASAEITELRTQTRLTARTSELSRHGCYYYCVINITSVFRNKTDSGGTVGRDTLQFEFVV